MGEFRALPREAAQPHRNQENARTGRRSLTVLSSHQAHQSTAISQARGTKSRPEYGAESIPALSHLNTLLPASMRRPRRVPEKPEPNRGETGLGRGSPSRGEPCEAIGTLEQAEMESRQEAPRKEEPILSSLSSISSVSRLTESGAPITPCPRQKRDREGGERRPAQERAASASAVKWPEAEGRPGLTPEPGSARQWLLARRICLMRSRNPPHGLQGIRPAGKRKNAGERHAEKSPAPAADQRAASLSKAPEEREPRIASRRPPGSSA